MQDLDHAADGLLAFLQDGLVRLSEDGVDASEAKLTCLADSAVLLTDMAQASSHHRIEASIAVLRTMLWSVAAENLLHRPGPECWAVMLGRGFLDPRGLREALGNTPSLSGRAREAAAVVLELGPPWRPFEILALQQRAQIDLDADPSVLRDVVEAALSATQADYTLCHVVIYATDFGRAKVAPNLRRRAEPLLESAAAEFALTPGLVDLGLEILLAHRYLTGRWHRAIRAWTDTKVPEFVNELTKVRRAGLDLPQFLRLYHAALLAARITLDPAIPANCTEEPGGDDE